jgi:LysM repeat protein
MADAVTSQTIFDGEREAVMKFTNVSDGTGETSVVKVTASSLNPSAAGRACDGVAITKVHVSCRTMGVNIQWDATSDVACFIASPGMYTFDFEAMQLSNNAGAGVNGNVVFSTIGAAAGATYTIVLEMVKSYV